MRRGDAADWLVVIGVVLLGWAVWAAWGGPGLLGYLGALCLAVGATMAWAEAGRK